MPFIDKAARKELERRVPKTPGELCYLFYLRLLQAWRADPRWTTVDLLYRDMRAWDPFGDNPKGSAAYELAWQVFFQLHVMPYELTKREDNGDIL